MLDSIFRDLRAWRHREMARREISRLDPRLRADIGLTTLGHDDAQASRALFNVRFDRS